MKSSIKRVFAVSALGMAFYAPAALAAPDAFYFQQAAGWVDPVTDGEAGTFCNCGLAGLNAPIQMVNPTAPVPPYPANTFERMQWTSPSVQFPGPSSITLTSFTDSSSPSNSNPAAGDTNSDGKWNQGEFWIIDKLRQDNLQILMTSNPYPLWVADTLANLRVFDDAARTNQIFLDANSRTRISFFESLNAANCDTNNPAFPGILPNLVGAPCNDVFTVESVELAPVVFDYNGSSYLLSFALAPGQGTLVCPSPDPLCAQPGANPPAGQIRVYTAEESFTELFVAMAWREIIPAPSVLALFGTGLLGLGWLGGRRRKAS